MARWLFGLGMIGLLVFGVLHFGDVEAFGETLRRAEPQWLIAAVILQASTYISVSLGWSAILTAGGAPRTLRHLAPIALTKLFADQMIPLAGMGGNMLLIDRLIALTVPRNVAVAVPLVSMIGFYGAYASLAAIAWGLLWLNGKATLAIDVVVVLFLVVALAIPTLALSLRHRGRRRLSPALERFAAVRNLLHIVGEAPDRLLRDRRLILRVALLNGLVFVADAATLTVCFRAIGQPVSFETAFIALIAASITVTLGPLPLGLGSFEAGSTVMLTLLKVPIESALAATLLLRGFTLWLPLLPGFVMMRPAPRKRPSEVA